MPHQDYIEAIGRSADFDVADVAAVFAFVLNSLPDRVAVFPTENYSYFRFNDRGVRYMGNIRLASGARDEGKVHFAYQVETTAWRDAGKDPVYHALLGAADGVRVERVEPLLYRVTFRGRSVLFALNDLSKVTPPAGLLGPRERYIGPVADESGLRFFLVYNAAIRAFHYVLDETERVPEQFFAASFSERVAIGRRTGFAFYRDARRPRKILIGVYAGNVALNNYLDGPFDQLPDNFIAGETLRDALIEAVPALKGRIDRLGRRGDGEARYAIVPYLEYGAPEDLAAMARCAARRRGDERRYYRCLVVEGDGRPPAAASRPGKARPAAGNKDPAGRR
jgi:hypothetical protein